MPEYRCPKHDKVFTTLSDDRAPGSGEAGKKGEKDYRQKHPDHGHPDCPLCKDEQKEQQKKNESPNQQPTGVMRDQPQPQPQTEGRRKIA